jgi:hypothetical protein
METNEEESFLEYIFENMDEISETIEDSDSDLSISSSIILESVSEDDPYDEWVSILFDEQEINSEFDEDKTDGKYYIGLPGFIRNTDEYILSSSVSNATFFKYDFNSISRFLVDYSCDFIFNPCVHILQLHISNSGVYNVTLKTFWLKIVQRTWKNIYAKRKQVLFKRRQLNNIILRQIKGNLNDGSDHFPSLYGMLYSLKTPVK